MDWKWLSDHAEAEWRVLSEAPAATAIAAALIAGVLYAVFNLDFAHSRGANPGMANHHCA